MATHSTSAKAVYATPILRRRRMPSAGANNSTFIFTLTPTENKAQPTNHYRRLMYGAINAHSTSFPTTSNKYARAQIPHLVLGKRQNGTIGKHHRKAIVEHPEYK
jgi:hypothetical protein